MTKIALPEILLGIVYYALKTRKTNVDADVVFSRLMSAIFFPRTSTTQTAGLKWQGEGNASGLVIF